MIVFNLSHFVNFVFWIFLISFSFCSVLLLFCSLLVFPTEFTCKAFDVSRIYCVFICCDICVFLVVLLFLCGKHSNPSSFCYGTAAVQDDAAPGTQEYIMLRQDSIHSADIRSKGSPFRAKCHEIFCCPLKQVVLKENAEPEGLFATPSCFNLLMLLA